MELSLKGAAENILWYSSNAAVASVDEGGFVIARAEGTAIIVAKCCGKKYRCTITVENKDLHASVDEITIYDETMLTLTSDDESSYNFV